MTDELPSSRRPLAALAGTTSGEPEALARPEVSFEFFPPKTEKMEEILWASVKRLEPLGPRFVSVTYGAGGSTRERTHATVARILRETSLVPAAHLTCVGSSRAEVDEVARGYWQAGVRHIVALRGDPPAGADGHEPHLEFVARARKAGITVPIVPGILPVTNFAQVVKFSAMCGATVPDWLARLFEGLDGDTETRKLVAATVAAEQCRALRAAGVDEFHFYTLNRADLSYAISHILGIRPLRAGKDAGRETGG